MTGRALPALALLALLLAARPDFGVAQEVPGIVVERITAPRSPGIPIGDRVITIVRVDLARYAFRFLTARDGPARPLDRWVHDFHLAGGINAGMFLPDGRPCGYVRMRGDVISSRRPSTFDAVVAFDPIGRGARFAIGGPGCARGLDGLMATHASILQSRRLLVDCAGHATDWRTNRYSAAALGADGEGRAVLVHVRTPYRMQVLARMLAEPSLGIRGLVYMEGGPEASVVVDAEGQHVGEMGSWEDGFHEADDNREYWDLPNVVAFEPR